MRLHYMKAASKSFTPCSSDGCAKNAHRTANGRKGMCSAHYTKWSRTRADRPACRIPGCNAVATVRALCPKHRYREKAHGTPTGGRTPPGEAMNFIECVVLSFEGDECLFWPYRTNHLGYGWIWVDGAHMGTHRYVCQRTHGSAPTPNHHAAHTCGNGHLGCVNPRHLSWKTARENAADKVAHGTVNRGARNPSAKLTDEKVRAMRRLKGKAQQKEIAAAFGVSEMTVSLVMRNKVWTHL